MSITHTDSVECVCKTPVMMPFADSLNAGRHPHLKQALLERTLHAYVCDACGARLVVEKDMMYFDFERRQFFCMYPAQERAREAVCSAQVKQAFQIWMVERAPKLVADSAKDFLVRVCFGYEELREKIVIDDAGLADLVIEAVKIDVLTADPWFEQSGVVTLRLDAVQPDGALRFLPEWLSGLAPPEGVEPRVATVSRAIYDEVEAKFDEILVRHPGLAKGAHVSLLRLIDWPA